MRRIPPLALVALLCASSCSGQNNELGSTSQAASTGSTVIPSTGQTFDIAITSPADGATVPLGLFTVHGNVAIGSVAGTPVNVSSVVDLSGSTSGYAGMDCNGDGVHDGLDDINGDHTPGDILDCEISGVIALNTSLFGTVSVDVGIIGFGDSASAADMQSIPGQQSFTAPPEVDANGNGLVDHEEVARSLDQGRIGLFTAANVGTYTNFDGALATLNTAFAGQPAGEQSLAFFLSDGNPCGPSGCSSYNWPYTGLAGPLGDAVAAGTVINTFAVGTSVLGCVPGSPLQEIADETNGTCTDVSDPTELNSALPGLTPSGLDRVEVNGVAVPVDPVGNFSLDMVCVAGEVIDIVAIGYADDVDGTVVQADISVSCCEDIDGDGLCDGDDLCPLDAANDADADGICGDVDLCAGTTIPESVPTKKLLVNRWALVDGDGVFDTVSPGGEGPELAYTIEDTAGCSCEQITEALGLGAGHSKFGCSISAMDDWIASLP